MALSQKLQKTQETIRKLATHRRDRSPEARRDRRRAMIGILVTAMVLATSGIDASIKKAQTLAFSKSIEGDDFWLRAMTGIVQADILATRAEMLAFTLPQDGKGEDRVNAWKAAAARLSSNPEAGDGVKELVGRAHKAEATRDLTLWQLERYALGSSALHLGIFTASTSLVTGLPILALVGAVSGLGGFAVGAHAWAVGFGLYGLR